MGSHKFKIINLMSTMTICNDFTEKLKLFQKLKSEIIDHILIEELSSFHHESNNIRLKRVKEHHIIRNHLQKLNLLNGHETQWLETFEKLQFCLNRHFKVHEPKYKMA